MIRVLFLLIFLLITALNLPAQNIIHLGQDDVYDFRFSPNGSLVYMQNKKSVSIWDIQKKSMIGSLERGADNSIISLDITKDSSLLVASSLDSVIAIWSLTNYALLKKIKTNSIANKVAFGNSNKIVFAGLRNGDLIMINTQTGDITMRKESGLKEVTCICISDNMEVMAISGSDGIIQMLNPITFNIYGQEKIHSNFVRDLAFSDDGKQLYSCGDDGKVVCSSINYKILEKDHNVHKKLRKPWIMSLDFMSPHVIAYASLRGKVIIKSIESQYSYHVSEKIFKMHFMPQKNGYIVVGLATNNGLEIVWATKMKFKSN